MCQQCCRTTAAAVSLSLAMTNPELIWAHQQDQKQRAAHCRTSQAQSQPQSSIQPSSASTYSESTTYSYDKDRSYNDTKQKRSMRQRIKQTIRDLGNPPTARSDRHEGRVAEESKPDRGPMASSMPSRT